MRRHTLIVLVALGWLTGCDRPDADRTAPPIIVNHDIIVDHDAAVLRLQRGNELMAGGDRDAALAEYDAAIRLDNELTIAYYNRGVIRDLQGYVDGAIADYSRALELAPGLQAALTNRAILYTDTGRHRLALADSTEVIAVDHFGDHNAIQPVTFDANVIDFVTEHCQLVTERIGIKLGINPLAQPGFCNFHRAYRNCRRKRRSFSKNVRRSVTP